MVSLKGVIAQGKAEGMSKGEIESELLKKGYSRSEISAAFGSGKRSRKVKESGKVPVFEKLKLLFSNPVGFFESVRETSIGPSLILFVIIGIIMAGVSFVFTLFISRAFLSGGLLLLFSGIFFLVFFVMGVIGTFVYSGITHLVVKGLHGEQGYSKTYNAVTYSLIPYLVLAVVPYIGFLGIVYSIILMIFGLSEYHNISKGKAAIAALVPFIIFIALFFLFVIMIITSIGRVF
jgi:hypothetical protein